jgi:hypothetical protein
MLKAVVFAVGLVHLAVSMKEIESFMEVKEILDRHHPDETLVVFDIDNTLITPETDLGSDQWFYCLYEAIGAKPLEDAKLDLELVERWNNVQYDIRVRPSEDVLPGWLESLQSRGFKTMALTARNHAMLDVSVSQLASVNINFPQSDPCTISKDLLAGVEEAKFSHGVLAIGESNVKAHSLNVFFQTCTNTMRNIKTILFFDDKHYHCQGLDELKLEKIHIETFRYSQLDTRVKNFKCDVEETRRFLGRSGVVAASM